ncbi:hypothetical protein MKX64_22285 [Paenibacillus sp. FSL M8-0334]|uniref:YtkA-like domain-containing protein n=1 Tax=Paenibacillus campinasensis TaxID=66347 RepID=A0ABW9T2W1_9BACL|nr:hypothetical protein [Paenibacillus campinasensis]MUG66791.1 hypothetical protein [Paenibacillus campinasensis]
MKAQLVRLLAVFAVLIIVIACSREEPVDLEAVDVELSTMPETVKAGHPVELRATVTGMTVTDKARATFDIRVGDQPLLLDAVHEGNGAFSGTFTFPDQGVQAVFIHLYAEDIHITKKKQVEIK